MSFTTILKTLFGRGNGSARPDTNGPTPVITATASDSILRSLEEKQALLAHMVRMVARKVSYGLFVAGVGGTGKSKVITETLASEGVCPVLLNSHITPLALFQTLYQYRDGHVIWLDDCDGIYPNLKILGLLRSALWGQGERIVTYTSSQLADMPNSFVFTSRIICCANTLPSARNEAFKAVLSRIDVFQLNATNEEILDLMHTLAERGYGSLSSETCRQVVDFIAKSGTVRQLSLRLYEPSLKKVQYAQENGIDWRELVRCQLEQLGQKERVAPADSKTFLNACMSHAIAANPDSVMAQEHQWCEITGKSRATFYRTKKAFEVEQTALNP
jgi:hypothetical protein